MALDLAVLQAAIAAQHEQMPFSGVITLHGPGGPLLAESRGFANRAEAIPNSLNTRFAIASGAKTFTAVAACQLVEQGRLRFDTRLAEAVDAPFPQFHPGITVHHLLCHSAGNPDYFDEEVQDDYEATWRERPMYAFREPRDFLPLFQNLPMKFQPGERFAYSNAGYILLGLIVEAASGQPFPEYVRAHVLEPAGMGDSGYFALDQLPERTAYGYIHDAGRGWRANFYSVPLVGGPDGGIYTTAPDLDKFWEALAGGRLLAPATVERMFTPHLPTKPESDETHHGYGLWIAKQAGAIQAYYMLGEDPGAAFISVLYPATGLQFTLIGNTVPETWAMFDRVRPLLGGVPA
jgi:CubicO group peptidase (beta-lactamase class C family)